MNIYYWLRYLILALFRVLLRLLRAIKKKFGQFWLFCRCLTWRTLREVSVKAGEQRLPGRSAEMAYNSMLAPFPGLLAMLCAIALFELLQPTLYQIAGLLGEVIPDDVRNLIRISLKEILSYRNQQLFSLSFVASIWAFSGVMSAAMAALDRIGLYSIGHWLVVISCTLSVVEGFFIICYDNSQPATVNNLLLITG